MRYEPCTREIVSSIQKIRGADPEGESLTAHRRAGIVRCEVYPMLCPWTALERSRRTPRCALCRLSVRLILPLRISREKHPKCVNSQRSAQRNVEQRNESENQARMRAQVWRSSNHHPA